MTHSLCSNGVPGIFSSIAFIIVCHLVGENPILRGVLMMSVCNSSIFCLCLSISLSPHGLAGIFLKLRWHFDGDVDVDSLHLLNPLATSSLEI